jgi:hypothetical protein
MNVGEYKNRGKGDQEKDNKKGKEKLIFCQVQHLIPINRFS